jgi:hypothetical protein
MTGRIKQSFRNGRESISDFQSSVSGGTRKAVRRTDYYVHDHAWKMIGAAAGLAFFTGFLLSRRNQEAIAASIDADETGSREVHKKVQKLNSWEFLHSSLPLALFLWKAVQASRCARKGAI